MMMFWMPNHATAIFYVIFFKQPLSIENQLKSVCEFRGTRPTFFFWWIHVSQTSEALQIHWKWINAGQFRSFEAYTLGNPNQDRQGFPCESLSTEISLRFTQPRWWTYRLFAGMVGSYDQWLDKWAILITASQFIPPIFIQLYIHSPIQQRTS